MGTIAKHKNLITLYFSSKNTIGKQVEPYVVSSEKKVRSIDISKTNVTETQWTELAEGLNMKISDLIDQEHPDFTNKYGDGQKSMSPTDWLKILNNHPELLKYPILIDGNEYYSLQSASAFKKHMEPDSARIEKT
ncbi:arsenate reductase family protein [Maribacter sp. 2210JD10-5]|uniref:arsenate reductase family protein n=1 Tax=Maribacter sp. 2210JD10-5 TaxID=3386272 RepID=UPI0039BC7B6E